MDCAAVLSSVRRPALAAAVRVMSCMWDRTFYSPSLVTNLHPVFVTKFILLHNFWRTILSQFWRFFLMQKKRAPRRRGTVLKKRQFPRAEKKRGLWIQEFLHLRCWTLLRRKSWWRCKLNGSPLCAVVYGRKFWEDSCMSAALPFNERKATQAAAHFLKLAGGKMDYRKLMLLLYLADRKALLTWGRPQGCLIKNRLKNKEMGLQIDANDSTWIGMKKEENGFIDF